MHLQLFLPWPWLLIGFVLMTGLLIIDTRRLLHGHRRHSCYLHAFLRGMALASLCLLLARPRLVTRTPQLDKLKTAVLVDVSRSMETLDQDTTRRERAETILNHQPSQAFLNRSHRTDYFAFANGLMPLSTDTQGQFRLSSQPGNTHLGDALKQLLNLSAQGTPYATVLLISDGRNIEGISPLAIAKQFRAENIPISTVRFAGGASLPDVGIEATSPTMKAMKNRSFTVQATLNATTATFSGLPVELLSDNLVIASGTATVIPGKPTTVSLTGKLMLPGFHILSLRVRPTAQDAKPDNNTDFISVEVAEPPVFNILYMDYGMDWEWRFLKQNFSRGKQLNPCAVIQTGKDQFTTDNLPEEWASKPGFPEHPKQLEGFDVIITSTACLTHLSPSQQQALRAFVEHKGGGLVIRGTGTHVPDTLLPLLPAKTLHPLRISRPRSLHFRHDLIYAKEHAHQMHPQGGIWIQPPHGVTAIQQPRHSTRTVATLDDGHGETVFAVHAFGAGRVAFMGYAETWRWALGDSVTAKLHENLWNRLMVWLAQSGKPMVRVLEHGTRLAAGIPHDITMDVLGNDFKPSLDATVSVTITPPSGQAITRQALPDWDHAGRYLLSVTPQEPGDYKLAITTRQDQTETQTEAAFLATQDSRETNQVKADEQLMQDLSRITGGKDFTPEGFMKDFANTPFSKNVPLKETSRWLIPPWLLFVLFAISLSSAWYVRRHLGLK